jgi:hypothetical protein
MQINTVLDARLRRHDEIVAAAAVFKEQEAVSK